MDADYQRKDVIPAGAVSYRVVAVLASGGMGGDVYDVEHTWLGRRFVLKVIPKRYVRRHDLCIRFVRGVQVLGRLEHRNIVAVVDLGQTRGPSSVPYCVMLRLQGETVRSVLAREGRLPVHRALDIAIDVLEAAVYAHENGVVHCDIKAENVFLHYEGATPIAKLIDWTNLKLLGATTGDSIIRERTFGGTLANAPPEQLLTPLLVTPKSDVWSVGILLFHMLTGLHPLTKGCRTKEEIIEAIRTREALVPSDHVQVPSELDALVLAALTKAPAERPTAFALLTRLKAVRQELERHAGPVPADPQATVEEPIPSRRGPIAISELPPWPPPNNASSEQPEGIAADTDVSPPPSEVSRVETPTGAGHLTAEERARDDKETPVPETVPSSRRAARRRDSSS